MAYTPEQAARLAVLDAQLAHVRFDSRKSMARKVLAAMESPRGTIIQDRAVPHTHLREQIGNFTGVGAFRCHDWEPPKALDEMTIADARRHYRWVVARDRRRIFQPWAREIALAALVYVLRRTVAVSADVRVAA